MESLLLTSENISQTQKLARQVAKQLKGGEILFFSGSIGAGKTVMVKEIVKELGFKKTTVSASFSLLKKYKGDKFNLYHADLFRLDEGEMFNLGFEEMLEDHTSVLLVEWPEPAKSFFPQNRLEITVILLEADKRQIRFKAIGKTAQKIIEGLCKRKIQNKIII